MESLFGWMLIAGAAAPFWYAARSVRRGSVRIGDQVSKTTHTREDEPGAFWFGIGFYLLLGAGLVVLGALQVAGVLG